MAAPTVPWITADELIGPCAEAVRPADLTDAVLADALLVATEIMFLASGSRFPGAQTDTFRPQDNRCGCPAGRPGCRRVPELRLPGYPVRSVTSVLVDGVAVDPLEYRVDDDRYLVRLPDADGDNVGWPCCQRLDLDPSEDDTFQVTYVWGADPPPGGKRAVARLACELALAAVPATAGSCRLPAGQVQQISRQGVSIVLHDLSLYEKGRTGLPEVDLWLGALEAGRRSGGGKVTDPYRLASRGRRARRPPGVDGS